MFPNILANIIGGQSPLLDVPVPGLQLLRQITGENPIIQNMPLMELGLPTTSVLSGDSEEEGKNKENDFMKGMLTLIAGQL